MHAYDMDTVAGHEIIVRRAQKDEKFVDSGRPGENSGRFCTDDL